MRDLGKDFDHEYYQSQLRGLSQISEKNLAKQLHYARKYGMLTNESYIAFTTLAINKFPRLAVSLTEEERLWATRARLGVL